MIIEETLKQRLQGVKNEAGVWVTPAFPKLIYVLEDDNITEDSRYFTSQSSQPDARQRGLFLITYQRRR